MSATCPHRAHQLAVRAQRRPAPSCCASTTPTRALDRGVRRAASRRTCAGSASSGTRRASPSASALLRRGGRAAEGGRAALSLLRDAGGARAEAQAPAAARPAAGLRPRRAEADACRARRGSKPRGASRTGASCWTRADGAPGTTWCAGRSISTRRSLSRPRAGARRRQLSLHAALGGRRHRPRHQPCHPRRRPCHQHRRADRSSSRRSAREPPVFAHLPLLIDASGEGLSKRIGTPVDRRAARRRHRADGGRAYLARLGTGEPVEPTASLDALLPAFDLARFAGASPRFDPAELAISMPGCSTRCPGKRRRRLAARGIGGIERGAVAGGARQSRAPVRPSPCGAPSRMARSCRSSRTRRLAPPPPSFCRRSPGWSTWEIWTGGSARPPAAREKPYSSRCASR